MTLELEEHKRVVNQFRVRQDDDEANIQQRSHEVEELRAEVERLGLEVRRLRAIIEDSLQERRRGRPLDKIGDSLLVQVDVDAEDEANDDNEEEASEIGASYDLPSVVETSDERAPDWELYGADEQQAPPPPAPTHVDDLRRLRVRPNTPVLSTVAEERSSSLRGSPEPVVQSRPQSRLSQRAHSNLQPAQQRRQQRPITPVRDVEEEEEQEFKSRATFNSSGRPPRRFINVRLLGRLSSFANIY